jgi:hypothetical protein
MSTHFDFSSLSYDELSSKVAPRGDAVAQKAELDKLVWTTPE